jgi:hypothetical protein
MIFRGSRDRTDAAVTKRDLLKRGVDVVSITQRTDK